MNDEDKHNWTLPFKPKKSLSDTFDREWTCIRCQCQRLRSKYDNVLIYSRSGIYYGTTRPDCFGSVPINDQGID